MRRRWISLLALLLMLGMVIPFSTQAKQQVSHERASQSAEPSTTASFARPGPRISPAMSALKSQGEDSFVEPRETLVQSIVRRQLGQQASHAQVEQAAEEYLQAWRASSFHGPDHDDYARLLNNEQRALAQGSSPAALGLAVTGTLRLLTVAVEFTGTDTVANFSHPISFDNRTCVTDTVTYAGPLHNQIVHPSPRDNFSGWKSDYNQDYYEKLVLSTTGITERVRLDLTDPEDGLPGIDLSGQSMRNYFEEVSGGRVQFDTGPAGVLAWVPLPHSEGYYAADACIAGDAGRIQSMEGLPSNPKFGSGVDQLVIDMVDKINQANPNFPWDDYDLDDDGVVDHVVIFHAGKDRSGGGGVQGTQAIWAHRGSVGTSGYVADDNGTPSDTSDDVKLIGYTMQYEDVETGVLVHEFGHDLGLPDLYDTSGTGESSVVWWDLMSTGSNSGKLIGTHPTHMSAWTKFALGWADPEVLSLTAEKDEVMLGQTSNPPAGTEQAVRVDLPDHVTQHTQLLPGSTQSWWTGHDQNWADLTLTRDVDLITATGSISISFDTDYIIEEDWDFMFVEVSVDGGATYTQTKGFEVGTNAELTTPDGYSDPHDRLDHYGGLRYGYTGDSHGWLRAYHNLTPYAGQAIKLRFRMATDAAFLERGAFVDNIRISAASGVILNDPVENSNLNGWMPDVDSFATDPLGAGWQFSNGFERFSQYYLLEWRNFDGFDEGLRYTYNTVFAEITAQGAEEFNVDHVPSNVPGMVVYHRDTRYGLEPFDADNSILDESHFFDTPSEGPKGGLLVLDANPQPLRGPRNGKITTGVGTFPYPPGNNWRGRVQTTNAAFGLIQTPGITLTVATGAALSTTTMLTPTYYAPMAGVDGFHDSLGYYPGVEEVAPIWTSGSNNRRYTLVDPDASAVVPATGYYPMKTPPGYTGKASNGGAFDLIADFPIGTGVAGTFYASALGICGVNLGGSVLVVDPGACYGEESIGEQSGNPGDAWVQHGYHFRVVDQADDGSYGVVQLWDAQYAAELDGVFGKTQVDSTFPVTVEVRNIGSPTQLMVYSDFDESKTAYVEGSATNGAIPVRASAQQIQAAADTRGEQGLEALRVSANEATAIIWSQQLSAGETGGFSYELKRLAPGGSVINTVFGPDFYETQTARALGPADWRVYLPLIMRG